MRPGAQRAVPAQICPGARSIGFLQLLRRPTPSRVAQVRTPPGLASPRPLSLADHPRQALGSSGLSRRRFLAILQESKDTRRMSKRSLHPSLGLCIHSPKKRNTTRFMPKVNSTASARQPRPAQKRFPSAKATQEQRRVTNPGIEISKVRTKGRCPLAPDARSARRKGLHLTIEARRCLHSSKGLTVS